jgi:hypothetical protein
VEAINTEKPLHQSLLNARFNQSLEKPTLDDGSLPRDLCPRFPAQGALDDPAAGFGTFLAKRRT